MSAEERPSKDVMRVVPVPMLDDNYGYLLIDTATRQCAAVDPVTPETVLAAAKHEGATVAMVLTTHCHWDHAGGNEGMAAAILGLEIVGGHGDGAAAVTREVRHGDVLELGALRVRALATPCHTPGHTCYHATDGSGAGAGAGTDAEAAGSDGETKTDAASAPAREGAGAGATVAAQAAGGPGVVFTGDTLFSSGCGKFNAGTPEQMHHALNTVLAGLPGDTEVYNGHEYTLANLKFALDVDSKNPAGPNKNLAYKQDACAALVRAGGTTLPTTIRAELATNPFMRVTSPECQAYTGKTDPVEVMGALRAMKNSFRPKM